MKHAEISPDYKAIKPFGLPGWTGSLLSAGHAGDREKFLLKHVRVLIALNVVSIALALLLFAGLFLSWSSSSELNTIRTELAGLQQFEKRLLTRMDTMNNGVQHRLSKIDQRLGAIQSDVGLVAKGRRDPATTVESIATMIRNDGPYFGTVTAELLLAPELSGQNSQRFVPGQATSVPALPRRGTPEEEMSLFTRVTTEDGKVRYEMKR